MMRVLEANAPPKQTATDTISTLSSRLASATLLEDRRAAILGLRSFAKEYPASVASGALRGLIAAITNDADDVDTLKVVLETLLMLFHPDEKSPEASEEIALWLADQFSQRQDNITLLVDLLEKPDFYSRLYSLQLLRAVSLARPERTQECILAAPGGIERLVATLDDPRDAVRNEGLVALTDLARTSSELQKLFVFEDAFTKVFNMIHSDGGLAQGGVVVQDCLSLLATLIRHNTSNQTNVREMGHVARFAALLPGGKKPKKAKVNAEEEDNWVSPQADKNVWGLLAIMRMFLVKGSASTMQNQNVFQQHGLLRQLLDIAFDPATAHPIRIEALNTCADLIRGNARLQEGFAQEQVRPFVQTATTDAASSDGIQTVYVIEALLNLVLNPASHDLFDVRMAGCECIKAYFYNHGQIRGHFLNRAIGGHEEGDETANALSILLAGPQASPSSDPYRVWFSAVLVYHLISDDYQAKDTLMGVVEGDADSGEEVVTCIQTFVANLIASLQLGEDERISVAYLMLLLGWLFEDAAAVDDFLEEGSCLQSLVQAILMPGSDRVVIRGLCAALLGVVYEFSTRDSPVPRRALQPVLTTKLGREKYLDAITELRRHPLVRDFEVLPRGGGASGNLPGVLFDEAFIDFLKDNFSRLSRAIDRDPNIEQHQSQNGVDRDVMDALRGERDEKEHAIQDLRAQYMALEQKLDQEQAEHRKTQQSAEEQRSTLKRINDKLHNDLEQEAAIRARQHKQATLELENKFNLQIVALNNKIQQGSKDANTAITKMRQEYEEMLNEANRTRVDLERQLRGAEIARQEAVTKFGSLTQAEQRTQSELSKATEAIHRLQTQTQQLESQSDQLKQEKDVLQKQLEDETSASRLAHTKQISDLIAAHKTEVSALQTTIEKLKSEVQEVKTKIQDQTWKIKDAEEKLRKAEANAKKAAEASSKLVSKDKDNNIKVLEEKLKKVEESEKEKQTELDDLFVLLSDLEEKRKEDKKRLKALGEEVSDIEDEDGDDDDDDDEEEEDEDEENE
ncbi:Vesicle-mediated ER to Golgi transport protein [Coniothyrium glycines]